MSVERATTALRDEHARILEVVGVLERILDARTGGLDDGALDDRALDVGALEECTQFFRLFTDACHHGKEEDVLFPELVEQGVPGEEGPIAVMLREHQQGRMLIRRMRAALAALKGGVVAAADELDAAGRGYIDLIRDHIGKEDHVLFEMADGLLEGPPCQRVCRAYHEVCSRRFDGRTHADLEALATSLLEAYPPPA